MCTRPKLLNIGRLSGHGIDQFKFCPCGMCHECRTMRREDYTFRVKAEIQSYNYIASFVTLTYRDDTLPRLLPAGSAVPGSFFRGGKPPYDSCVYKPDLQRFLDVFNKRFRRKYGYPCKYVAVSEYGSDFFRPHYHIILIGCSCSERRMVYDVWNKGMIDIQPVGNGCIRYVMKYLDKQVFTYNALENTYGDFPPPFAFFSKGLGERFFKKNIDKFDMYGRLHFTSNHFYTLNPYYRDKYGFSKKPYTGIFNESDLKYALKNNLDLYTAHCTRTALSELSIERNDIIHGKPLYRCSKAIYKRVLDSCKIPQDVTRLTMSFPDELLSPTPDVISLHSRVDLTPQQLNSVYKSYDL